MKYLITVLLIATCITVLTIAINSTVGIDTTVAIVQSANVVQNGNMYFTIKCTNRKKIDRMKVSPYDDEAWLARQISEGDTILVHRSCTGYWYLDGAIGEKFTPLTSIF